MANQTELRAAILQAHQGLLKTLDGMSAGELARRTPNEGWTGHDNFAHLATIERRQRDQIECAVQGKPYEVQEDIDTYNARMVEERRNWTVAQLRDELQREQATTLALIDSLRPDDLGRTFQHPRRGPMTVERVLDNICGHLQTHLQDVNAVKSAS